MNILLILSQEFLTPNDCLNVSNTCHQLYAEFNNDIIWKNYGLKSGIYSPKKKAKKYKTWKSLYFKVFHKLCKNCFINIGFPFCNSCLAFFILQTDFDELFINIDDDEKITKTSAKKHFLLNNDDIWGLTYIECMNPFYENAEPMKLYYKRDIIKRMIFKYGNFDGLQIAYDKRCNKRNYKKY